jgi:hypothetical protein
MDRLKVYYNSACRSATPASEARGSALKEIGAHQEFVRERLHVVDEKGAAAHRRRGVPRAVGAYARTGRAGTAYRPAAAEPALEVGLQRVRGAVIRLESR